MVVDGGLVGRWLVVGDGGENMVVCCFAKTMEFITFVIHF